MRAGVRNALWIAVALGTVCLAAWLDRDTAYLDQARYCHMVAEGYWPDYEDSFAEFCEVDGSVKGDERDPFAKSE